MARTAIRVPPFSITNVPTLLSLRLYLYAFDKGIYYIVSDFLHQYTDCKLFAPLETAAAERHFNSPSQ
jgi:hypothetical protein